MSKWTNPDHETMLRRLWADGVSCTQSALALNRAFADASYTRNAVIGKVHRLGLSGRAVPSKPQRIVFKAPRPVKPAPAPKPDRPMTLSGQPWQAGQIAGEAKPPAPLPERYVDETAGTATILTLGARMCRWPIGDPQSESFTFCGRRREDEVRSYCGAHNAIAYAPASTRKNKAPQSAAELARSLRRYI